MLRQSSTLRSIIWILFGAALFSFGLQYLIIPNGLYEGGVTGINLMLYYLFKLQPSVMNLVLNIPIFWLGWKILGKRILYLSLAGTLSVTVWLGVFEHLPIVLPLEHDLLIVVLLAGIIMGTGLGIIFKAGGTTGGSDILARILHNYFPSLSIGRAMLTLDVAVLVLTVLVFQNLRLVTYTLIFVSIVSRMIDFVGDFGYGSKGIMIMSTKSQELAEAIDAEIERGITFIKGQGFYSKANLDIVYTVIDKRQLQETKDLIHRIDPTAFITITDAYEVLGEGFTLDANKEPLHSK